MLPVTCVLAGSAPSARKRSASEAACAATTAASEDHREARLHAAEEAPHRARQVVGQVAHLREIAEQRPRARGARGREGRDGERQLWMTARERAHERRAGLHLADRYRVHPHAVRRARRAEAEALGEGAPVAAVAQAAPEQHRGDERNGETESEPVEKSQGAVRSFQAGTGLATDSR
jgi:hypothetical protein